LQKASGIVALNDNKSPVSKIGSGFHGMDLL
jgi:hypothetical protein